MIWNILQQYEHQRCRVIRCCVLKKNGPVALRKQNGAQKPKVQSSFTAKLLFNNNILGCTCLVLYTYDIWFVWRDRWMVWLGRVEAWTAEEVNHWNYDKQGIHYAVYIQCEQTHNLLMHDFVCRPNTMYTNEATSGHCCHSQACWRQHSFGKKCSPDILSVAP